MGGHNTATKANPGKYQEVFDLVPWGNKPNCFDADAQPRAGKLHPKKAPVAYKATNEYTNLFEG